jgi:pyrimidine-nucleoside phosphorylase
MRAVDVIRKKRDGLALDRAEIDAFVQGATSHAWPDYQVSALLMAIVLRGMSDQETAWLTHAMTHSGDTLDWSDLPGVKVDKHSTGGVGDKTSLVLVPLAAVCGVIVPKMSGRGLGHTGGTLDKLESIPGFRVALPMAEYKQAVRQIGCALVGQTAKMAPADKVLYALRDVTATVESIPLIAASVMSKKLAEGIDALVLDVKCGRGAFMKKREDARALAETMVAIGKANGVRTQALVTAKDAPLGRAVGNSLEVIEALEALKGQGPPELARLCVRLAAHMLLLAGVSKSATEAEDKARAALASGRALEKFRQLVVQQHGDPRVIDDYQKLPQAPQRLLVRAEKAGYVTAVDAEQVGVATVLLGAGRNRTEEAIDHAVGCVVLAQLGEAVKAGDPLVEVHYADEKKRDAALALIRQAWRIEDRPPPELPLILETVE